MLVLTEGALLPLRTPAVGEYKRVAFLFLSHTPEAKEPDTDPQIKTNRKDCSLEHPRSILRERRKLTGVLTEQLKPPQFSPSHSPPLPHTPEHSPHILALGRGCYIQNSKFSYFLISKNDFILMEHSICVK